MSREIPKFRAWVKDLKEYRVVASIHYVLMNKEWTTIPSYVTLYGNKWADKDISRAIQDVVLEQSTGLEDKNGKEIWVGDILKTCCGDMEVYFDDELLMYKIKAKHGGTMPLVSKKSKRHFDYEVIGNIHENPELLGGWRMKEES